MAKSRKNNEFECFAKDFLVQLCVFLLDICFPTKDRVLWSFVIMERIPISRPFDKFHPVVYLVTYLDIMNIINGKIKCIYLPLTFNTISCIRIGS